MKTKKLISITLCMLFSLVLFSQSSKDISDIFTLSNHRLFRNEAFVDDAVYLKLKTDKLTKVFRNKNEVLHLNIPISNSKKAEMTLTRFKVFTDDFVLKTSDGKVIPDYKKPIAYRAELTNMDGFATIIMTEEDISGIISIEGVGNYNLGKLLDSRDDYIIYNDRKVKINLSKPCNVTQDYYIFEKTTRINNKIKYRNNCVKFYLEGDYALYQDKGSSVSNAATYMTDLFAEMATLYDNEQIDIEIKEMMIWTSADGYSTSSSSTALDQFSANNPDKNADLCHLFALGGNNTGGLAWIDVLCDDTYKFAYSNISSSYQNVPTYSWSVECITHETGHNFGSKHTHDCVWNGDNTQIDDCGPESGNPGSPGDCYDSNNPKLPNKGTIMSYCHLISSIGIDFNLGFGTQPGDLIRDKYNNAACLTACEASTTCDIPVNLEVTNISGTTAKLEWKVGASGAKWEVEYGLAGFSPGTGTVVSNITNTFLNLTGLSVAKTYDWYIRTDCSNGDFSNWVGAKQFTTICVAPGATVLPFTEDWESDNGTMQNDGYINCDADKNWYFETDDQGKGRVKWGTDCPTNMVITGDGALIMDRYPNGPVTINSSTLTLDLSNYSNSNDLLFYFSYKDKGDESHDNDKVWVRGDDTESWLEAYNLDPGSVPDGQVVTVKIDLDSILTDGGQSPGTAFQIKLGQEDNYAYGSDGIAFDDIKIIDCNRESIPYETDFSGDNDCWSIEDTNNDGYTWATTNGAACDQDYFGLIYSGSTNPSVDMNDWLFSPGIELTPGDYQVSFTVGDGGVDEKLEVYLSDDNTSTDALSGTLLYKDEAIDNFTCNKATIDFTVNTQGYYYICFHGYSDGNTQHNLFIDDFKIDDNPGFSGTMVATNTNNTCDEYITTGVAGSNWHNIYDSSNKIVASINPNGQTLGNVTIQMRDGGNVETQNINGIDVKTIPRYFNFNADNTFANDVSIRLYLLDAELTEFNTTSPPTSYTISDLQINHYDGSNEDCDWGNNTDDGTTYLQSSITTGNVNNGIDYYMQIDVGSFSEFIIRQDGSGTQALKYNIDAIKKGEDNIIKWELFESENIEKIFIEKRNTETNWETIFQFDNKKQDWESSYFIDKNPYTLTYYRFTFVDFSGIKNISKMLVVENLKYNFELKNIYPNPNKGDFTIKVNTLENQKLTIQIKTLLGEDIYKETFTTFGYSTTKKLNLSYLKRGLYFIILHQGGKEIINKIVVDK